MAVDRQLPQFFAKVNRWGVPYYAVLVSFLFGPLAYLSEPLSQLIEPHTDLGQVLDLVVLRRLSHGSSHCPPSRVCWLG
jgi:amino acid transporter